MVDKIRWGILGTGGIAKTFANGLSVLPDAELVAVGSRTQGTADEFGSQFNVPHRHPTYEALAADPDVDVIYVSTPHNFHAENSLLCLEYGKAVLTEKPFTINAKEAEAVIQKAREKKLFLLEAMWTRYLPPMVRLREMLAEGVIGDPRWIEANFGFRININPEGRLFNLNLGGGALLDVGIYPISFSSMIFGTPNKISSTATFGETGADEQSAALFSYEGGQIAVITAAIRTQTPQTVVIAGTEGMIHIPSPWWNTVEFTITRGGKSETITPPRQGNGYNYEAAEVMRCMREGKLESDVMPLDETLSLMQTLDTIRGQWGFKYPGEQ